MTRHICSDALEMIKNFEGLRLESYPDPGSGADPWTVGHGHTGPEVVAGYRVTEQEAEALLIADIRKFSSCVEANVPGLNQHQFCAVVSWAFNVGCGAVASSTLRKRILAGEDPAEVIPVELPRWVHGANGPMPGLVRRREAEVAHAALEASCEAPGVRGVTSLSEGPSGGTEAPQEPLAINLRDFFLYFTGSSVNQDEAIEILEEALRGQNVLLSDHPWVQRYRRRTEIILPDSMTLDVRYFYQLDSEFESQAGRMCFSSTAGMLCEYLKPGSLKGSNADDDYLVEVLTHGDTTSAHAQIKALAYYGVDAEFRGDGTQEKIKELLRASIPVPCGILHYGPENRPKGGGHWLLVVGFDDAQDSYICHDSFGKLDCINGGYLSNTPSAGCYVRYPASSFDKRWQVEGKATGWFLEATK